MRCPRCQFENMPGYSRCFKCGSVLDSKASVVEVYPPRMAAWKKPFRSAARWARVRCSGPEETIRGLIPDWAKKIPRGPLACLVLSIFLPGLGHLAQGRFRQVGWYCLVWLLLIAGGLFVYGGGLGFCILGAGIALHAWIAGHQLMRALTGGRWKLLVVGIALSVLLLIYGTVPRAILRDFVVARTALTIPYQNVQPGDYLLARRSRAHRELIRHGSLVLARLVRTLDRARYVEGTMIVQVVALPGDTLELKEGHFILNGRQLDAERYPVPRWLRGGDFSVKMGHDRYFVSSEYEIYTPRRGPTQGVTAEYIFSVSIIGHADIEAQAFMLWLPLSRRRFIRAVE